MNDYQTVLAMLTRAHIPHTRDHQPSVAEHLGRPEPNSRVAPPGSISILVPRDPNTDDPYDEVDQPYPGGFSGFYGEIVFGPDRNLIAIWAWE